MRRLPTLLFAALLATQALPSALLGQGLSLPSEVRGKPGRFLLVEAKTDAKAVLWLAEGDTLDVFPDELLAAKTKTVVVGPAGRHKLWAVGCVGEKLHKAFTWVVVEGDVPVPPGPKPPGPDALATALKAAYAAEKDPAKALQLAALTGVYRHGAMVALDQAIVTWGSLFANLADKAKEWEAVGKLPAVQKAIRADALARFPESGDLKAALPADRSAVSAYFGRVTLSLEGLAK